MIFASDLDQTLIYSQRFVDEHDSPVCPIELFEGREISFISKYSRTLLQKINEQMLFIPVTTRTLAQYERISLFHDLIRPKYAITSNGATILKDGKVDELWKCQVDNRVRNESASYSDIIQKFQDISTVDWVLSSKMAEELFFYFIIDRSKLPKDDVEEFGEWANTQNWSMSIQGRKLYLIPNAINKGDAVKHIVEREGARPLIAAGDSLLDLPMLEIANQAIVPPHGEIYQFAQTNNKLDYITFTQSQGVSASEEILKEVVAHLSESVNP